MRLVGSSIYDLLDNKVLKSAIAIFFRGAPRTSIEIIDHNLLVPILRL